MEVSGQKLIKNKDATLCSLCEDFDITTYADGFCVECEVYFCNSCFVKHKGRKISRNHSLVKIDDSNSVTITAVDTYDICQQHNGEFVKFYCPKHDQVGCGECSVLYHNGCKLEFIRDKVAAVSTSRDSRDIIQEIARCKKDVEDSASLLDINRQQLSELYEQFVCDVEAFADHVIERIKIMKTSVLNQAREIMLKDKKQMDELQNQTDDLIAELTRQTNLLETINNQPNKLFVASMQVKSHLKSTKENVEIVKKKNIVTQYKFQRDEILAESIKESKVIGLLIEQSINKTESAVTCKIEDTTKAGASQKLQPLHDRKLVCKNLKIDGECLSYAAYESNAIGLYVFKEDVRAGLFFEIEILSIGKSGLLAIGVVPDRYPDNLLPGVDNYSCGYHSDGNVFRGSTSGKKSGDAWKVGDRIKCQLNFNLRNLRRRVIFTHNGREIGRYCLSFSGYHFAVGMKSREDKIQVISLPEK